MKDIPIYKTFSKIEPIEKGWSGDKKYYIETTSGEHLLLRIADISKYEQKKADYDALCRAATLGLYTPQPRGIGKCDGDSKVYCIATWLEGEEVASNLTKITDTEKYTLGIKAGEFLRKLHMLPAPSDAEPWENFFLKKIDERLADYHMNKGQTTTGEIAIKYLNDNSHLIKNRPQTFNHGDFNITNVIVASNGEVGALDFNCCTNGDYGDPLFDMLHILYTDIPDSHYYTGLWNGYTAGKPDSTFFEMMSYYFAYDVLASLGGDEAFDNGDFDKKVLAWYDNFNTTVPTWYLNNLYM